MTTTLETPVTTGDTGFRVRLGQVWAEGVVGNSPGPLKTVEETEALFQTSTAMVTLGSITLEGRFGNAEPRYWEDGLGVHTHNAIGLANRGLEYYLEYLPHLIELSGQAGKPLVVSLAPERIDELEEMVGRLKNLPITIELNYSCPNADVIFEDTRKVVTMWALEPKLVQRSLFRVRQVFAGNLVAKFIYHPDDDYVETMAQIVKAEGVNAVALINTIGGTMILDPSTLRPVVTRNFGGLSGSSILPIGLGTVAKWRMKLDPSIDIVAEGGITTGYDILQYLVCGANVCRVGSEYGRKGRKVFGQLTAQFAEEMVRRGYSSLADIPRFLNNPPLPVWQPA